MGKPVWNTGLTKETCKGLQKQSEKMKGKHPWNFELTKEMDVRLMERSNRLTGSGRMGPKKAGKKLIAIKNAKNMKRLWQDPKYVAIQMKSRGVAPNKCEKGLDRILQQFFPNQWKFVGCGDFILAGKCPDFIHTSKKKIIELFGDYWHSEEKTGVPTEQHMLERKRIFSKCGYQTLIVWEHELKDIETLMKKVETFQLKYLGP